MKVQFELTSNDIKKEAKEPKEMMSFHREEGKYFFKINPSSLDLITTCPKKADLALNQNLRSNLQGSALIFGSAIHAALEVWYLTPPNERPIFIDKKLEETAYMLGMNPHGNEIDHGSDLFLTAIYAFISAAKELHLLPDSDKRSIKAGIWLLTHYFNTYASEDQQYVTYKDDKGSFVERRMEFELYNSPHLNITMFGTVDLALQDLSTGKILPTDHKTTSQIGTDFFNRIKPNSQITTYTMAMNRLIDPSIDSFMINGLQTKAIPKTSRGTPPGFVRQVTMRSEEDFEEHTKDVIAHCKSWVTFNEEGHFPKGPINSCANYGGCQYLELCSTSKEMAERVIASKYQDTQQN